MALIELPVEDLRKHLHLMMSLGIKEKVTLEHDSEKLNLKGLNEGNSIFYSGNINTSGEKFLLTLPINTLYRVILSHSKETKISLKQNKTSVTFRTCNTTFRLPKLQEETNFPSIPEFDVVTTPLLCDLQGLISKIDFIIPSTVDRTSKEIQKTVMLSTVDNVLSALALREYFVGRTETPLTGDFEKRSVLLPSELILFIQRLKDTFLTISTNSSGTIKLTTDSSVVIASLPSGKYPPVYKVFDSVVNNSNELEVSTEELINLLSRLKTFQSTSGNYIKMSLKSSGVEFSARHDSLGSITVNLEDFSYRGKELDLLLLGFDMVFRAVNKNKKEKRTTLLIGKPGKPVVIKLGSSVYITTSKKVSSIAQGSKR